MVVMVRGDVPPSDEQLGAITSSPHSDAFRAAHLTMALGSQSFLTTQEPQGILASLICG